MSSIILVTGGNTGLGLEIVKSLLRSSQTYTILLGGRSLDKATAAAKSAAAATEEEKGSKSTVEPIQIDIDDDESIKTCVESVERRWGRLDILVNNAGM